MRAFVCIARVCAVQMLRLFIKDFGLQRMPFIVVHFVQNLHVQDGRDNGSESDHRKSNKLCARRLVKRVRQDGRRTHEVNNAAGQPAARAASPPVDGRGSAGIRTIQLDPRLSESLLVSRSPAPVVHPRAGVIDVEEGGRGDRVEALVHDPDVQTGKSRSLL